MPTTLTPIRVREPDGERDVHEALLMSKHLVRDLENLQREVDELRGKYEGRIITESTVST